MADMLKSSLGDLWVQKEPAGALEWLGSCVDLGDLAEPAGDVSKTQCRNRDGQYETVGETQAAPGAVTANIRRLLFSETSILDELKRCAPNVYVTMRTCGQAGTFENWVRAFILLRARITTRTFSGLVAREDTESAQAIDVSADNPLLKPVALTVRTQTIAETTDLNDIAFCNTEQCAGSCGPAKLPGTDGFIVGDSPAGSPASKADVWETDDGGAGWDYSSGPHPFAAAEDVMSNTCFPMDASTTRWLVAREPSGADVAEIAYSDDGGVTWTNKNVGSVAGEGAAGEGALFSFDRDHIWFATTEGNVYFSEDGGITWTLQSGAATADAGDSLNVIKFSDFDNGWAVGDSDAVIKTTDGGTSWEAVTSPTTADNVTALEVFSKNRAIIGSNADELYHTSDGGVTWVAKTFTGQSNNGTIKALDYANDLCGFMLHNPAVGQGYVHQTINGGQSWKRLDTPANAGLNAQHVIDENETFVVGAVYGGTGFVAHVSA